MDMQSMYLIIKDSIFLLQLLVPSGALCDMDVDVGKANNGQHQHVLKATHD